MKEYRDLKKVQRRFVSDIYSWLFRGIEICHMRERGLEGFMEVGRSIEKEFLNVKELSEYLGLKPATIYEWVKIGEIPHYRLHKMKRFKREEIDAWMEQRKGCGIVVDKRAKRILEIAKSPKPDVDKVVRKAIEEVGRGNHNGTNGNQTKVKGLRKEVTNGNL
jgi:excisionase family DNA binding protein